MSDSSLVSYTSISPNCNHPRKHAIDTITIHHMAGDLSVETCGKLFQRQSREASSNYGIGSDGRIALYVHEEDRAWTSGSPANDNRAITIEVANDGGAETNWHVSDKAMESLIALLVDVCKRSGIQRLVWSENKDDRIHHRNGCNMTVHRDFQATACPGPYLYSKQGWIAEQVNKRLEEKDMTEEERYAEWKRFKERDAAETAALPASDWAKNAINMNIADGTMVGYPDGFHARSNITRQETAQVAENVKATLREYVDRRIEEILKEMK